MSLHTEGFSEKNRDRMSKLYELLYLVPGHIADTEVDEAAKVVEAVVTKAGGNVKSRQNLGKIKLAYPIQQVRAATYMLAYIEMEPAATAILDQSLRLSNLAPRHMLLETTPEAAAKTWQLQSYVPPLNEEGRPVHRERAGRAGVPAAAAPFVAAPIAAPLADVAPMSVEELDKKLDEILETDLSADA